MAPPARKQPRSQDRWAESPSLRSRGGALLTALGGCPSGGRGREGTGTHGHPQLVVPAWTLPGANTCPRFLPARTWAHGAPAPGRDPGPTGAPLGSQSPPAACCSVCAKQRRNGSFRESRGLQLRSIRASLRDSLGALWGRVPAGLGKAGEGLGHSVVFNTREFLRKPQQRDPPACPWVALLGHLHRSCHQEMCATSQLRRADGCARVLRPHVELSMCCPPGSSLSHQTRDSSQWPQGLEVSPGGSRYQRRSCENRVYASPPPTPPGARMEPTSKAACERFPRQKGPSISPGIKASVLQRKIANKKFNFRN